MSAEGWKGVCGRAREEQKALQISMINSYRCGPAMEPETMS